MNIKDLTPDQFNCLSWLATCSFNMMNSPEKQKSQFDIGKLQGIASACAFAGIPDNLIYDVDINKNFSGLRNWNRLTETKYFI